jgi:hypothetical protein
VRTSGRRLCGLPAQRWWSEIYSNRPTFIGSSAAVGAVSPWDIGGGDQLAFERVGLPSFGFIQDPIEYDTRTHHTSADVFERIQPEDLQVNTAVLASFAWQAAQRDEKLPR